MPPAARAPAAAAVAMNSRFVTPAMTLLLPRRSRLIVVTAVSPCQAAEPRLSADEDWRSLFHERLPSLGIVGAVEARLFQSVDPLWIAPRRIAGDLVDRGLGG